MKSICLVGLIFGVAIAVIVAVDAAGECGNPNMDAMKLIPCADAAKNEDATVSSGCCAQVRKMGQNPKCLCAAVLSDLAKSSGVDPQIAITIPKRCNIANRPIGYKCGAYTLP